MQRRSRYRKTYTFPCKPTSYVSYTHVKIVSCFCYFRQKINDSKYGLTAAVFTSRVELAQQMAPLLNVGTVFMNRCDFVDPRCVVYTSKKTYLQFGFSLCSCYIVCYIVFHSLPWAGRQDSGKGTTLSQFGFNGFTNPSDI